MGREYNERELNEMLDDALSAAERDDNVLFIDDIIAAMPISKATFYAHWPKDSDGYKQVVAVLAKNRIKVKKYIRLKLRLSGKASELLALYRMICTEEERKAIATNYNKTDVTSGGKAVNIIIDNGNGNGNG